MKLRSIETPKQENIAKAKQVISDAVDMEYESVIIFGFKDGYVHRSYSGCINYLEKVGALEEAKALLIRD